MTSLWGFHQVYLPLERIVAFCIIMHEISAALTPSDSRSDWASESAADKGLYNLKLKYVFPFIQCQCSNKRRGVLLLEQVSGCLA